MRTEGGKNKTRMKLHKCIRESVNPSLSFFFTFFLMIPVIQDSKIKTASNQRHDQQQDELKPKEGREEYVFLFRLITYST